MNKLSSFGLISLSALILTTSCSKVVGDGMGTVSFSLENNWEISDITKSNVADFTTLPQSGQFKVSITDAQDAVTPVNDISQAVALAAGNYSAKAEFGSCSEEGFDKPCFIGSKEFSVQGGSRTDVSINVKLANCLVKVETTPEFRKYYTDYNFTITSGAGTEVLFAKDESRAAFFDAYLIRVKGSLVGQNGKSVNFESKEYKNLAPATCYTLKFDVSNVGSSSIKISFNDSAEDVSLGEYELNN